VALQSLKAASELEQTLQQAAEENGDQQSAQKLEERLANTRRSAELIEKGLRLTSREERGE
jgi:hypothetical protein